MPIAPFAVLLGLAAGLVARPGGRRPAPVRALPVLAAGWLLDTALDVTRVPAPGALAALAAAAMLLAVLANLRQVGATVVAVGLAANLAVVAANGAVPVRAAALAAVGAGTERPGGGRELEDGATRLAVLGDVVPLPGVPLVVSFGDLVALVGLVDVSANYVRARRRRRGGVVVDLRPATPAAAAADADAVPLDTRRVRSAS